MVLSADGREAAGNRLNGGATESGAGMFPGARMGERGKGDSVNSVCTAEGLQARAPSC